MFNVRVSFRVSPIPFEKPNISTVIHWDLPHGTLNVLTVYSVVVKIRDCSEMFSGVTFPHAALDNVTVISVCCYDWLKSKGLFTSGEGYPSKRVTLASGFP